MNSQTIRSMTGYGRSELLRDKSLWTAEIRCVNNRFLDTKIKLPKGYFALEENIRKKLAQLFHRGRVDLVIGRDETGIVACQVQANIPLAKEYSAAFGEICLELNLPDQSTLALLASMPDVISRRQEDEDLEAVWQDLEKLLEEAVHHCDDMRCREGRILVEDILNRLQKFTETTDTIEKMVPALVEQKKKNLEDRLAKLLDSVQLDPLRLMQEVALLADKTDVSEEIVRLRSHISQFKQYLDAGVAVGRKLDFLVQEFLREVNTLASKISDAEVAHMTVELKSELEKIREQIQNIE